MLSSLGCKVDSRFLQIITLCFFFLSQLTCLNLKEVWASGCNPLNQQSYPCSSTVSTAQQLRDAVGTASQGDVICINDGTYSVSGLWINAQGVTLRSTSGIRESVILDGNYTHGQSLLNIVARNVTIADLTIQRVWYHPIHITGGSHDVLLHNLHIIDGREQFIKVNPSGGQKNDDGILQCSLLELTDNGRDFIQNNATSHPCYTGGIDNHGGDSWLVTQNTFKNIYCEDYSTTEFELAEHAIHFWVDSSNATVEKNRIINCARGIGFGLGTRGNSGGIIRNNMVYQGGVSGGVFDVGIGLESSPDTLVYNNTVYLTDYSNSMEYRFAATTNISIQNNLTNRNIRDRSSGCNSGPCVVDDNHEQAQASWFVDTANGDLHLDGRIAAVVDQGVDLAQVTDDYDGDQRISGSYDLGADEYQGDVPPTISNIDSTTADGHYRQGANIALQISFSEAVTSNGAVILQLNSGGSCVVSELTQPSLIGNCIYTVQEGDNSSDLNVTHVTAQIEDEDGLAMVNYTPLVNLAQNRDLIIDTIPPDISITSPANGSTVLGSDVVRFTQDSSGGESVCFIENNSVSPCESNHTTIGSLSGFGDIDEGVTFDLTLRVTDLAGNSSQQTIHLIKRPAPPTITRITSEDDDSSSLREGDTIQIDLYFSERIQSDGDISLDLDSGGSCLIGRITSPSSQGSCDYTVLEGEKSGDLDVIDLNGVIRDQSDNVVQLNASTLPAGFNLADLKDFIVGNYNQMVWELFLPAIEHKGDRGKSIKVNE